MPAAAALTDEHKEAIEAGRVTLGELAQEFGVSKQAIHQALKRRGWATTPVPAPVPPAAALVPLPATPTTATGGGNATSTPIPAPATAHPQIPCLVDDRAGLAAKAVAGSIMFHVLAQVQTLVAGPHQVGAAALKGAVAAVDDALTVLERLDLIRLDDGDAAAPMMEIREMTAAQVEKIRARVEAEFGQEFDRADEGDDALSGRHRAPLSDEEPLAATEQRPALRGALEALQEPSEPPAIDLEHLAGRLQHLADQRGRIDLRRLAVEIDAQTAQATGEMIGHILTAVRRDPALAGMIDAELARHGL